MANAHTNRHNTWTFTAYPESLPPDWEARMADLHVSLCYILHDSDVYTAEDERADEGRKAGEPKKPHYHVLAKYDGVKTLAQVQEDFAFTGISYIEPVRSFRTMCRYLCHLDEPVKHQYPVDSVVCVSGFSPDFSRKFSKSEELAQIVSMTEFVEDNDISEFAALWAYSAKNEPDWLSILSSKSAYGISQYIRSRRCAEQTRSMREREREMASLCA